MKEYWPEHVTRKSWERLISLKKEINFVLIGGWAIYLYTSLYKSKDIDIVIDLNTLSFLKSKYLVQKNNRLKKYEIKEEGYDIDIYVPYFSNLIIPPEEILKKPTVIIKGIKTTTPEVLLMLKLSAFEQRKGSIKGEKDKIDIIALLMKSGINLHEFNNLAIKHKKKEYITLTERIIRNFDSYEYLNIPLREFQKWKKQVIAKLKELK